MNVIKSIVMEGGNNGVHMPLSVSVEAKGKVCIVSISGHISEWSKANAGNVLKDILAAKADGATSCEIYVNSPGGNVFEANEMANLIEDNFDADKITVKVGALCASAGTIFPAKYPSTGKSNTQCMIHKPSMYVGGNEDEIKASLKLLKDLTGQYRAMYANKFGITEDEVDALWDKGDYWMNAKEAKKMGLLDSIENEAEKIDATMHLQLVACGAPQTYKPEGTKHNENKNENPKTIRMELSVLAVQLGLPATATQAEVDAKLAEIKALAEKATKLENDAKVKAEAEKAGKIKALLDNAEKDKKIDPSMRSHYENIGNANLESLEAILDKAAPVAALSGQLNQKGPEASTDGVDRSKWTFADYQEKAPEAFIKLSETDPEKAQALADAHYKEN